MYSSLRGLTAKDVLSYNVLCINYICRTLSELLVLVHLKLSLANLERTIINSCSMIVLLQASTLYFDGIIPLLQCCFFPVSNSPTGFQTSIEALSFASDACTIAFSVT